MEDADIEMEKRIGSLCFVTPEYPIDGDMTNTFVDALICEIAKQGIQCTVIAPFDVFRYLRHKGKKRPRHWKRVVNSSTSFDVYCPPYYAFLGHKGIADLSQSIYNSVVVNEFKRISKWKKIDAVYGHFFGAGGLAAELIGRQFGIPSFVACGESSLNKLYGHEKQRKYIECAERVTGIICVSTKNKDEVLEVWGSKSKLSKEIEAKIEIFPNGFNTAEFGVLNKEAIRNELGIGQSEFVVSFLGRFQEHKGINVLESALRKIGNVGSVFLGSGEHEHDCPNIRFSGQVNHSEVAKYLNATDIFVLPTKAEGCSNAIVEALACGLPVVSSNLPFNFDILNDSNSILIDPTSVDELVAAICKLKTDLQMRKQLSNGALKTARELTIDARAKKIIAFISQHSSDIVHVLN